MKTLLNQDFLAFFVLVKFWKLLSLRYFIVKYLFLYDQSVNIFNLKI